MPNGQQGDIPAGCLSPVAPGAQAAPEESSVILLAILSTKRDDFLLTSATTALQTRGIRASSPPSESGLSIHGADFRGEVPASPDRWADADCLTMRTP